MDLRKSIFSLFFLVLFMVPIESSNGVFRVQHKFAGRQRSLHALKAHDNLRHRRILAAVDLQLGGNGQPAEIGLYFTKIGIGSPPEDYYVQVDTGSDLLWVNCIQCNKCPKKSSLGIELSLYDPNGSKTSKLVTCDQDFCSSTFNGPISGCTSGMLCPYSVMYGDGSGSAGYYVQDFVQYDQVTGNFQTTLANGSVIFGCGAKQSGDLSSSSADALDGILGFGQSNSSMISQLASSGKVKKMFAHCLDSVKGGGIFAIGHMVQPKVKTTPLVPNQPHYNVNMKAIEVGNADLQLSTDIFETGERKGTIIDSGTTLAYLPEEVYNQVINAIMSSQPNLSIHTVDEQFSCFEYTASVDEEFPTVTFHFEDSLSLTVYPHEYLFLIHENIWCIGWQNSGLQSKDGKDMTLLGDLVLQNKLVLYDLENQAIGWTEYNCSSSIKVQDEKSGVAYFVGAHDLSSACGLVVGGVMTFLLLICHFSFFTI